LYLYQCLKRAEKKTEDHEGYYCDISQILSESKNSDYLHLNSLINSMDFSLICDSKGDSMSPTLYRLNDDKVILWLKCKIERLQQLVLSSPNLIPAAQATSFRSTTQHNITTNDALQTALGFLSEYISENRLTKLAQQYGVLLPSSNIKPALSNSHEISNENKKHNIERKEKQITKKPKLSPAQSKLAKVNLKGMSKLDTFFVKKKS